MFNGLPNAEQARRQVEQMESTEGKKVQARIAVAIEAAIEAGQTVCSPQVPQKFHRQMERELSNRGYTVNAGNSQRDGEWFQISW